MPCPITTRSAVKKSTRKNNREKRVFKKNHSKNSYLNYKAPSNNVKLQSDKTLTTQIYFFLTTHQMGFFLNDTR